MRAKQNVAFTLIELLVVVGIIALLIGILTPAIGRARLSAKRTQCLANLSSVGKAIRGYMDEYNNFYPPMAVIPRDEEVEFPGNYRLPMADPNRPCLLGPYVNRQFEVFHCPSDRLIDMESITKNHKVQPTADETTWFKWQGSSYEPRTFLSIHGTGGYLKLSKEFRPLDFSDLQSQGASTKEIEELKILFEDLSKLSLVWDYENFHSPDGKAEPGSRMALFADSHAGNY